MSVAFHRGLTHEVMLRSQMSGLKIEEIDAQRALAGMPLVASEAGHWIEIIVTDTLADDKRHQLMKSWEEDHPGQDPFPDSFAQVVVAKLIAMDPDDALDACKEILELARKELLFG